MPVIVVVVEGEEETLQGMRTELGWLRRGWVVYRGLDFGTFVVVVVELVLRLRFGEGVELELE